MASSSSSSARKCTSCGASFGLLKTEKSCDECKEPFCSKCLEKPAPARHVKLCPMCVTLVLAPVSSREDLIKMSLRQLKFYLGHVQVPLVNVVEKEDLIRLIRQSLQDGIYPRLASLPGYRPPAPPPPPPMPQARPPSPPAYRQQQSPPASGSAAPGNAEDEWRRQQQTFHSGQHEVPSDTASAMEGQQDGGGGGEFFAAFAQNIAQNIAQAASRAAAAAAAQAAAAAAAAAEAGAQAQEHMQAAANAASQHLQQDEIFRAFFGNGAAPQFPGGGNSEDPHQRAHEEHHQQAAWNAFQAHMAAATAHQQHQHQHGPHQGAWTGTTTTGAPQTHTQTHTFTFTTEGGAPAGPPQPPPVPVSRQAKEQLLELASEEDIAGLSVSRLRQLLEANAVDHSGCVEKSELVERLARVWRELKAPQPEVPEDSQCKVCFEAAINCVFLECGHLVTCLDCGQQLTNCPVCRGRITRVVHVFRS